MTWTKLGDEFPAEARQLTDAEFRTHVEALCWSAFRLLDLEIPKAEVRRFAESSDAETAIKGLAAKGWWEDRGDCWHIGARFAEWQLERVVAEKRRQDDALRQRRKRAHRADDHRLCLPGNCPAVTRDVTRDVPRAEGRDGSGPTDPSVPKGQNREGQNSVGNLISGKEGSGLNRSAANSHNPRVHHGSDSATSDDQQIPIPVTLQSPAADRNAREVPPWKWINHEGTYLYDIGVNNDGSLHNPNGYPDETVRAAIEGAEERRRERRSKAATKAAETRRRRTEKRIYEVAQRIVDGHMFGPSGRCVVCKRGLGDPESIERGVGSECWQFVLEHIKPAAP